MSEIAKINDLFIEGKEALLGEKNGTPVLLWINKLNPFERDEAIKAGQVARSRFMLALKEIGSDEYTVFESSLKEADLATVRAALISTKGNEFFLEAIEAVRSDPDWQERLKVMDETSTETIQAMDPEDPELQLMVNLNEDYSAEVQKRMMKLRESSRAEIERMTEDEVRASYRESYLDSRGSAAFTREYSKHEMFYAVRVCKATTKDADGLWDHSGCDHSRRAFDSVEEVSQLADGAMQVIRRTITELTMERDRARFSGGQGSSSASSPLPVQQEESTPSTQDATSTVLAGTSS